MVYNGFEKTAFIDFEDSARLNPKQNEVIRYRSLKPSVYHPGNQVFETPFKIHF